MLLKHPRRRRIARTARARRGLGVIPVIAVFAIAVTVCALWTKSSISVHRDQLLREDRAQAVWLAEAGVRRAAARRAADAAFDGETWEIAADEIGRLSSAAVVIRLEPLDASPGAIRITASARYPADNPRVTISKTVIFTSPLPESSS
jgi:hypothetical protein